MDNNSDASCLLRSFVRLRTTSFKYNVFPNQVLWLLLKFFQLRGTSCCLGGSRPRSRRAGSLFVVGVVRGCGRILVSLASRMRWSRLARSVRSCAAALAVRAARSRGSRGSLRCRRGRSDFFSALSQPGGGPSTRRRRRRRAARREGRRRLKRRRERRRRNCSSFERTRFAVVASRVSRLLSRLFERMRRVSQKVSSLVFQVVEKPAARRWSLRARSSPARRRAEASRMARDARDSAVSVVFRARKAAG
mmetsp:Transcript_24706/g.79903  ORF Transcript_24706/g.79903 Transcript_24706/m.79903 type:complete len:249 (+) Transcript_24706:38-784(+)